MNMTLIFSQSFSLTSETHWISETGFLEVETREMLYMTLLECLYIHFEAFFYECKLPNRSAVSDTRFRHTFKKHKAVDYVKKE